MTQKISSSPDRHTFQKNNYIDRVVGEGNSLDDPNVKAMIEMYDSWTLRDEENLTNTEWQKNNMEFDMRRADWIVSKVRKSRVYAQNLYAALCNNDFQQLEVWPILKDQRWSCSWRHAGGIVADMCGAGDYIDWYCSGTRSTALIPPEEWADLTLEQRTGIKELEAFVGEGMITDEIMSDIKDLGWIFRDGDHNRL